MSKGAAILVGATLLLAGNAHAQDAPAAQTAAGALRTILFRGPDTGQGALSVDSSAVLYGLLLGETTTFPTGSSAGGFTWVFDSSLRVPVRRSQSFGPMFAERPFTTGSGRLNVGVVFQHTRFDSVGGQALTDLVESASYNFRESFYDFSSSVEVTVDRMITSATYGVHDKVDVGVIVPIGRARVAGYNGQFFQDFEGTRMSRQYSSGSSSGVGDVVIRTKAALWAARGFDAAAALDVRLPTGDPDKLLGTGATQGKAMFIGSSTLGRITPHTNVGYTFGGSGMTFGSDNRWTGSFGDPELIQREPSQEFDYTAGVDIAATSDITIAGDVIGRVVKNTATISVFDSGASSADRYTFLEVRPGTVHLLLGALGAKVRIGGSWLATGTVLFPLNEVGITPGVTPVIGFERAF